MIEWCKRGEKKEGRVKNISLFSFFFEVFSLSLFLMREKKKRKLLQDINRILEDFLKEGEIGIGEDRRV